MSDVFLSYVRDDAATARRVAEALEAAGHAVWWDDKLPAHRAYSEEIQLRLEQAKAVVVLWSKAAARSQWVRAEADFARSAGKLVQAQLDHGLPPMPFNQIQSASLKGWRGNVRHPGWEKLTASVAALVSGEEPATRVAGSSRWWTGPGARWISAAAVLLLLVAVFVAIRFAGSGETGRPRVAVPATLTVALLPFTVDQDDPQTRSIGLNSRDAIARMVSDGGSAIKLVAAATRNERADYFISGNVVASGNSIVATVLMEDGPSHVVIFSRRFEASRNTAQALPDQIGADVASSLSWTTPLLIAERKHHADPTIVAELFSGTAAPECCRSSLEAYRVARRVGQSAPDSIIAQVVLAYSTGSALHQIPAEQRVEATKIGAMR